MHTYSAHMHTQILLSEATQENMGILLYIELIVKDPFVLNLKCLH